MTDRLYFAYGSNMSTPRLRARIAQAAPLGRARWPGMALAFDKPGGDGTGKANLVARAAGCAWGVVFEIRESDWEILDRFEPGYARHPCEVVVDSGSRLAAQVYLAIRPAQPLPPHDDYRDHLIRGAREHGLPDHVVEHIRALARGRRE